MTENTPPITDEEIAALKLAQPEIEPEDANDPAPEPEAPYAEEDDTEEES